MLLFTIEKKAPRKIKIIPKTAILSKGTIFNSISKVQAMSIIPVAAKT
jgi:hypothetical protein